MARGGSVFVSGGFGGFVLDRADLVLIPRALSDTRLIFAAFGVSTFRVFQL